MQTTTITEIVLVPHQVSNLQLLINPETGEVFTSLRGLARLCGKASSTIKDWIVFGGFSNQSLKANTSKGVQVVGAYDETIIAQALEKYNPGLLLQCQKAGLRIFLHGLVGLKYELKREERESTSSNSTPKALVAAKYTKEIETLLGETNPRLAQYLIDHCINEVLGSSPKEPLIDKPSTTGVVPTDNSNGLFAVVEVAEEMGFSLDAGSRSQLGKFVKARLGHMAKYETRICNGKMLPVAVYPACELLRQTIEEFFKSRRSL
jgi:hypothetical protein